ncbi:hypothetical protein [Enterobacter sp.]|uniref:hypothetical protein n=1 Tax=Enterobacter sp. TaxID=42895 RepID=UPI00296F06C8|nr:hypothetical protein [Enterobacter sp.]
MHQPEKIGPVAVVRDRYGYWTHPLYFTPADDRDFGRPGEFDAWLAASELQLSIAYMDTEDGSPAALKYAFESSFSLWEPERPAGDGWFIGSIHENEDDGPVCIWLRAAPCAG